MKWTGKTGGADSGTEWQPLLVVVATCWAVSFIFLIMAVAGMRYATGLPRLVPMGGLDEPAAYDPRLTLESDRERFRRELAPIVAKQSTTEAKVLATLEWVMNQIPKVESRSAKSSWEMVEIGRAGGGLICGGMAQILKDALLAQGIPARSLTFQRNLFDLYDTHASVEAWVEGKWRLYDPTFHLTLKAGDKRVGAFDAREWFIKGHGTPVELEFLGEVKYPARVDRYAVRYEILFNNTYVDLRRDMWILSNIPFVGPWLSRELVYSHSDPGLSVMAQDFYRFLYYVTLVVLPAINLVLLFTMWRLWQKAPRCSSGADALVSE